MTTTITGHLREMKLQANDQVSYSIVVADSTSKEEMLPLNEHLGKEIEIIGLSHIHCQSCNKRIKKTYGGGYCYDCLMKLPQCDLCYVKPELCHYHKGTCRDPQWGEKTCFSPHYLYLSLTSAIKVGITRKNRYQQRWMEQGASMGILIGEVKNRKISGEIENHLKKYVMDKTNWRKMLQGSSYDMDMLQARQTMTEHLKNDLPKTVYEQILFDESSPMSIHYPVKHYLTKITSVSLDKSPHIQSTLMGMKGQYLILSNEVFNIKKHVGYEVTIRIH